MAEDKPNMPQSLRDSLDHTKVEYKRLGTSGLLVSNPILGAMSLGNPQWMDWVLDEEKSLPVLKAAYDRGINTWDTANIYSNGTSEIVIGKALKKYNIPRHKILIFTKCCLPTGQEQDVNPFLWPSEIKKARDYQNQAGLSRAAIFNQVNQSLERLDTDYIDLLQIHRFDKEVAIEETMKALHDLVQSGKVRYIGASSMWATQFARMQFCAERNGWTKFVSMQSQYSLIYREEEREMNRFCNETGVGLIPWSPLARGHLTRPVSAMGESSRSKMDRTNKFTSYGADNPDDVEIINRVEELAKKKGWTMSQVALAWINKRVTAPIVGFSSEKRIDENIAASGKELTEEEEKYLEELYKPKPIINFS